MSTPASLSKHASNSHFCGTSYSLGIKFAWDYPILSSNLTLVMWRFTSYDASNITPYINRDPTKFWYGPIMSNWDSCSPFNCLDLCFLTLLKGFFNRTYFHINWFVKMWTGASLVNVTIGNEVGWKDTPVCVWPPLYILAINTSIVRDSLDYINEKYLLTACWMGYSTITILMREQATIWMHVVNTTHFHAITLMTQTHL